MLGGEGKKKEIINVNESCCNCSMCKVLENRAQQDEERMDQLTNQLKEARLLAEDADGKSDEVSRKLAFVEDELEVAEDRVKSGEA